MELTVRDLDVNLSARKVLRGVGATLRPGRVTAILGPNGSGKTTLVKTLAGLIEADAGVVRYGQRILPRIPLADRARMIGYLPQDGAVHWNIGVRDLVALGRLPHRSPFAGPSAEDKSAVTVALAATDTLALADRRVDELSGGERARVLLARVMAGQPDWLLADEPLASLDPVHQIDMLDQFRLLARSGMGVVIVLHDLIHAARAADDILLLKEGHLTAAGPASEVLAPDPLREAFGIEVMMTMTTADGPLLPIPMGRAPG